MKIHDIAQGSPEWHALRASHFTASEAPAMMGVSKYQTRNALLAQKATGASDDVDASTQALFDRGHAAEAAARPIAEKIIGDELYPATVSEEIDGLSLLASLDGMTMAGDTLFEHKLWNAELAAIVRDCGLLGSIADFPLHYIMQLEQQLLVTDAEKVLFMVSDGTEDRCEWMWYRSNPGHRQHLLNGWKQFEADVANYQHVERAPAAVAAPVLSLPAVSVQVTGSIAIADNFKAFETALTDFIDNRLIREPKTDQDFADLDSQIKTLKKAEDALVAAEAAVVAQVASIDTMKRTKDMLYKLTRDNRLMAEKLLEAEKIRRRSEILEAGKKAFADHVATLNARLGKAYMPEIAADFAGVMKGKRTIASLEDAVATELARAKIAANEVADRVDLNLKTLREQAADHVFLFADTAQLVLKANDDVVNVIKARIAEHKAKIEREAEEAREKIRREEEARAQREAEQRAAAERERIRKEEAERVEREANEKAQREAAEAKAAAVPDPFPPAVVAPPAPAVTSAPAPRRVAASSSEYKNPGDQRIIDVLSRHFEVPPYVVVGWLSDMNLHAAANLAANQ